MTFNSCSEFEMQLFFTCGGASLCWRVPWLRRRNSGEHVNQTEPDHVKQYHLEVPMSDRWLVASDLIPLIQIGKDSVGFEESNSGRGEQILVYFMFVLVCASQQHPLMSSLPENWLQFNSRFPFDFDIHMPVAMPLYRRGRSLCSPSLLNNYRKVLLKPFLSSFSSSSYSKRQ